MMSVQEPKDDLSYWRQVATSDISEPTWFLSTTSTGLGMVLFLLMEVAVVPEGPDHRVEDFTCAQNRGPMSTQ